MSVLFIVIAVLLAINFIVMMAFFLRLGKKHTQMEDKFTQLGSNQERIEQVIKSEVSLSREEENTRARNNREELTGTLKLFEQAVEHRLGDSFKLISERLESVYRGLGEMKNLASSVGDLKKVLTNVKTRGILGEVQLGMLLEQILTPAQYDTNVVTKKGGSERVEFAVKLPGRDEDGKNPVWLPIDAKFPQEDYQRLLEAQEQANPELVERYAKQLEIRIKAEAKDIKDKYIDPPYTTDYGIMFVPTEGLFAEILRRPGLRELIQRDHRVMIAGPTILAALLNSLQMGFRTIAIEKHSSQVWQLLGVIKTEFAKFGDLLDKTKKKMQETVNTIDDASAKARNIRRKLRKVQELPVADAEPELDDFSGEEGAS